MTNDRVTDFGQIGDSDDYKGKVDTKKLDQMADEMLNLCADAGEHTLILVIVGGKEIGHHFNMQTDFMPETMAFFFRDAIQLQTAGINHVEEVKRLTELPPNEW